MIKISRLVIAGLLGLHCLGPGAFAHAATFPLPPPGTDIVGQVMVLAAKREDTLLDIARRYDLGYNEITEANPGVDPWLPGQGTRIWLPMQFVLPEAPREGMVLDLSAMRLFYYPEPRAGERPVVITYPIGIGRVNWESPLGVTSIVAKEEDPVWHIPPSIAEEHLQDGERLPESVAAGPNNPLGKYALRLGVSGYLIHGTNNPWGIGRRVSHGCVHLYPEDIAQLFPRIRRGTRVEFVDQPYLAGWLNGRLYLQAHRPLAETLAAYIRNLGPGFDAPGFDAPAFDAIERQIRNNHPVRIDWGRAAAVAHQGRSMPIPVSVAPSR